MYNSPYRTRPQNSPGLTGKSPMQSPSLPMLPGIRQYTPKRKSFGRHATFTCGTGGVMLEKERPASSPSRQQMSALNPIPQSPSLLRPSSALEFRNSPLSRSRPSPGPETNQMSATRRRKETAINKLKSLDLLAINQQRVGLQREIQQLEATESQLMSPLPGMAKSKSASVLSVSKLPRWVKMDREVLRWYAYSKDTVPESSNETYRIRKFVIYYYRADHTMRINEPKINNSGLPGGDIMERCQLKDPNGYPYKPSDLLSGREITVNARVYRIVDCDANTKNYIENTMKVPFGQPEAYPMDPFKESQKFSDAARMKNPTLSRRITNEALLGGRPGLTGHAVVKSLEQWMEKEGQTLSFLCVWDDTEERFGEIKRYKLVYHLEDDTIEIRNEMHQVGASLPPLMLKRCRLPKDYTKRNEIPDNPIGRNEEKYYIATDLVCGKYIHVFGRELMIYSCDRRTEMYYETVLGITQVPVHVHKKTPRLIEHKIPPYNGWGSEADSLASCMSLVPTPVKRDMLRFLENQGQTLRYQAVYTNPATPADAERRFIFTYYLEDQTCSIFEPPRPNSGLIGGKFLERGEYKRAIREKSKNELDPNAARKNHPLVKLLKEKMSQFMGGGNYMLLNAFKHFGGIGVGGDNITFVEFKQGCMMCGLPLSKKEARTLFNFYDTDNSGSLSFQEFVDGVMESDYGKFGAAASKSTSRWLRPSDFTIGSKIRIQFPKTGAETAEFEITGADEATLTIMEMRPEEFPKSNVDYIVKELATKLAQYNVNVGHTFKVHDTGNEGKISHAQFKAMIKKWSIDFGFVDEELTEQDLVTLVRYYDEDGDGTISYTEFANALKTAPIAFKDEVDQDHLEVAETRLYNELHGKPKEEVRHAFQEMDERGDGHITMEEFHHFLAHHGIDVTDEETAALMLHYDPDVKGYFNFDDFCDFIEAPDYLSTKTKRSKKQLGEEKKLQHYIQILKKREQKEGEKERLTKILKSFTRTFLRRKTVLRKAFMSRDVDGKGVISKEQFIKSLEKVTSVQEAQFPKKYLEEVLRMFFPKANSAVPFQEFMDVTFRGDIDTFKGLADRGVNFDDKNTWGNVHLDLDPNFDYIH